MARDAYIWGATALIGGAEGALDAHAYAEIQDGDPCITPVKGGAVYHHIFDSSSSAAESSPDVIAPDDVGENPGRWLLHSIAMQGRSLADEGSISLGSGKAGWVAVMAGDNEEYIKCRFSAAGVVAVISNSANALNTDTDGCLCIIDGGDHVDIKNRLGSAKAIRYVLNYS